MHQFWQSRAVCPELLRLFPSTPEDRNHKAHPQLGFADGSLGSRFLFPHSAHISPVIRLSLNLSPLSCPRQILPQAFWIPCPCLLPKQPFCFLPLIPATQGLSPCQDILWAVSRSKAPGHTQISQAAQTSQTKERAHSRSPGSSSARREPCIFTVILCFLEHCIRDSGSVQHSGLGVTAA